jgi:GDP-D-mannose dehydratase
MSQKTALITGFTGQDGAYLAEYLIKRDILCMALNAVLLCLIQTASIIFTRIRMRRTETLFFIMGT